MVGNLESHTPNKEYLQDMLCIVHCTIYIYFANLSNINITLKIMVWKRNFLSNMAKSFCVQCQFSKKNGKNKTRGYFSC